MMLLLHIVLVLQEAEDGARCAHGLLETVVEVRELADRIIELKEKDDEGTEHAHGHVAVLDFVAADPEQEGDGDGPDSVHERRTDGLNAHAAEVGPEESFRSVLETQDLPK